MPFSCSYVCTLMLGWSLHSTFPVQMYSLKKLCSNNRATYLQQHYVEIVVLSWTDLLQ